MEQRPLRVAMLSLADSHARHLATRGADGRVEAAAFSLQGPAQAVQAFGPELAVVVLAGLEVRTALRLAVVLAPGCPLVLAGEVPWPQVWFQGFARGVVGVLAPEAVDGAALLGLHASLPGRPGALRGSGAFGELPGFLDGLQLLGRTGTLVVRSPSEGVARAEYVGGEPVEARFGLRSGAEAWAALRAARGSWVFREHAGAGAALARARAELDVRAVRLLLVHADTGTLAARADHLARQGFQVVTAHGPVEALEALARGPFDAAVIDVAGAAEVERRLAVDLRSRETHLVLTPRPGGRLQAGLAAGAAPPEVEAAVRAGLAPRAEVQAQLRAWRLDDSLTLEVDAVGVQWLVRQLEAERVTGTLELRAGPLAARAWFVEGRLCQASGGDAWGVEALVPFLAADGVTGLLEVAGLPEGEGFAGAPTGVVLEALVARAEALGRPPGAPPVQAHASGVYRAA